MIKKTKCNVLSVPQRVYLGNVANNNVISYLTKGEYGVYKYQTERTFSTCSTILILAGIELNFFMVAGTELWFVFSRKKEFYVAQPYIISLHFLIS